MGCGGVGSKLVEVLFKAAMWPEVAGASRPRCGAAQGPWAPMETPFRRPKRGNCVPKTLV